MNDTLAKAVAGSKKRRAGDKLREKRREEYKKRERKRRRRDKLKIYLPELRRKRAEIHTKEVRLVLHNNSSGGVPQ